MCAPNFPPQIEFEFRPVLPERIFAYEFSNPFLDLSDPIFDPNYNILEEFEVTWNPEEFETVFEEYAT